MQIDITGKRHRNFRDAVNDLYETPWSDWWITGPRTCLWLMLFFVSNGGDPILWFNKFVSEGKPGSGHEGIDAMERDCRQFLCAVCFDQLNVPDIVAFELSARSVQVTAENYRFKFETGKDLDEEKAILYGTENVRGQIPMCPALRTHLAAELTKRNAIEKERRKAHEERLAANPKPNKPGKGDKPGANGG